MPVCYTPLLQCKDGASVNDSHNVISTADEASFTILTLFLSNNHWSDGFLSDMEDSHAADLSLDEAENSNTFFAVYDGHSGTF